MTSSDTGPGTRHPRHALPRSVADVLSDVAAVNHHIGPLTVELLNTEQGPAQAARLRELGDHLATLAEELHTRATEVDGHTLEHPQPVVIDAAD